MNARALRTLLAIACLAALFVSARLEAAPVYSYFPSASTVDGRMLCVAGDGLQTLSGTTVTLSFSVDASETAYSVGFFDGASAAMWDMMGATAFPTRFTLYADPLGDGTGSTTVAVWSDTMCASNAWTDFAVNNTVTARSPSGNYFYRLRVSATNPAIVSLNAFKMRVTGYTYIIPTTVFGYIGAFPDSNPAIVYPAWPALTPTTYDGTWDFWVSVGQQSSYINIWDGDFDVANDTNDPNTTIIPPFAPAPRRLRRRSAGQSGRRRRHRPLSANTERSLLGDHA